MAICSISWRPNACIHQAMPDRSISWPINNSSGNRTASSLRDNPAYRDWLIPQSYP
ncbi:Uncharacterised protein [Mycobacterium tuberculosis]|uniref:Uncharacterized protein n=1 Tax=Mycobacterium tuberculosis TaxID=1773 RepID=A0A916LB01_MYCTX|nr:Uncharacterised protein [Mycobacterium tuberculosis]COY01555.1 Uncharacterised protein [Mycobacterium tuberculosis]COY37686.1 Uncharacterised protein [Mycobacterium tuberculosis]